MTSHELARKLLEQPDMPVVLYNEKTDSWVPLHPFIHITVEELAEHPHQPSVMIRAKSGTPHILIALE